MASDSPPPLSAVERSTGSQASAAPRRKSRLDLVCFSHLRWDFVHQRPQHLMTRLARNGRILFVEEPHFGSADPVLVTSKVDNDICRVIPFLPDGLERDLQERIQADLLKKLIESTELVEYGLWFYTPMMLPLKRGLRPVVTIYDCMDELSAFLGAPPELLDREQKLLSVADVVFTGGQTLYEAKRHRHRNVHAFPSSIDFKHFARSRIIQNDPKDQAGISFPRLGFFGVIDERIDLALIEEVAARRPQWQLILVGPVVKIDDGVLPRNPNIHYLGMKSYGELPDYLAGWDVALLPFARNESTRFISPTKTPEYLAGGKPVISTSIRDVVKPYAEMGLVYIADNADELVQAVETILQETDAAKRRRQNAADAFLRRSSWDLTVERMAGLIESALQSRARP